MAFAWVVNSNPVAFAWVVNSNPVAFAWVVNSNPPRQRPLGCYWLPRQRPLGCYWLPRQRPLGCYWLPRQRPLGCYWLPRQRPLGCHWLPRHYSSISLVDLLKRSFIPVHIILPFWNLSCSCLFTSTHDGQVLVVYICSHPFMFAPWFMPRTRPQISWLP